MGRPSSMASAHLLQPAPTLGAYVRARVTDGAAINMVKRLLRHLINRRPQHASATKAFSTATAPMLDRYYHRQQLLDLQLGPNRREKTGRLVSVRTIPRHSRVHYRRVHLSPG